MKKAFMIIAVSILVIAIIIPMTGMASVQSNPVFSSTAVGLTSSMYATFDAYTKYTCSKIWVSSCKLQRMDANGNVISTTNVPAPSTYSTNSADFSADKSYSSYATSGYRYRLKVTFKATYNSTTYSTTSYSAIRTCN